MVGKLRILIDVDCVCNNLMDVTLEFFNRENSKSYTLDDFPEYEIERCLPPEETQIFLDIFLRKDLWDAVKPLPGAQSAIKKMMSDGHDVYFVTAAAVENATLKGEWLARYFPFVPWERVIICSCKEVVGGDYLIDDNLSHLKKRPYGRVCIDRHWNRNVRDDVYGIIRACDLNDAYRKILAEEERIGKDF